MFSKKKATKLRLLRRDGFLCWLCGEFLVFTENDNYLGFSIDHVIEQSQGGTDEISNLKLAHRDCNSNRRQWYPKSFGEN